jgi:hypothetical protein
MPVSPVLAFTVTMACNATAATFNVQGGYDAYVLHIPSMASGGDVSIAVAEKDGGSFRSLYLPQSLTSAPVAVAIASSFSNCAIPVFGLGQFFTINVSTAATATAYEFTVVCKAT